MFETGVVAGKFYPPHRGHSYLIDTARAQTTRLTVLVCDMQGQTISGAVRAAWLRELHPDVEVLVIDDRYDPDDSALWAKLTIGWLGYAPEAVFTSEDYGETYAGFMGATHIQVDKERLHVPISATRIRANPFAHWEYLAPPVRAYYAARVCLVGAESSGKTTLAQALAERYDTVWVQEYGREYTAIKMKGPDAEVWRSEEFTHIAREQSRREDLAAREANRILFCDTDAFTTGIWHERYLGACSAEVEAIAAPRRYALYLLNDIDIPFEQDGTRDGEFIRPWMQGRFRAELARRGQPVALLSGSLDTRLASASQLIDTQILATHALHAAGDGATALPHP